MAVKKFLEEKFPSLVGRITGGNEPPPPIIDVLLKAMTGIQLLTMGFVLFGDSLWTNVFKFRQVPSWYYSIKQYGFQFSLAIFFLIPQMLNSYVITGAFELVVDGEVVFSKLNEGRMPDATDIVVAFEQLGMVALK